MSVFIFFLSVSSAYASCIDLKSEYTSYDLWAKKQYDLYSSLPYNDSKKSTYYSEYQRIYALYKTSIDNYYVCLNNLSSIFSEALSNYNRGRYSEAIDWFSNYISTSWDPTDVDYKWARTNLSLSYQQIWNSSFFKEDYRGAISYYSKALEIDQKLLDANINIAKAYFNLNELNNAELYWKVAYNLATSKTDIDSIKILLTDITEKIDRETAKLNSPSNDALSYIQYYIKDLNIHTAWKQVTNPKQVIVAVIDDGISINHPDLTNNIWVAPGNSYGSSKIINFQDDNLPDNKTAWEHWTMVSGIIGATTNNNEGIAGIAKNVKLMPIRIFDLNWNTKEEYIIKAINYAIDNWANIINLSLGWSQFKYSKWMDEVINKAYDKGIFVVISWWNWDNLSDWKNGVNLDINPIAPVCNNSWNNYSFGVYATNKEGKRVEWSNYWKCTQFFAPWVSIVSTSIPTYNTNFWENYNALDWTSFSAPIVSWILALGYNKFGKVSYQIAFDALSKATTNNSKWNPVLDANKYLSNLESYFDKQILNRAKIKFQKYKKDYSSLGTTSRTKKFQDLLKLLQNKGKRLGGDLKKENDYIIDLIYKELGMQNNSKTNSIIQMKLQGTSINPITVITNRPKVTDSNKK